MKETKNIDFSFPKRDLKMSLPINKKAAPAFVTVFENKYSLKKMSFSFMAN